MSDHSFDIDNSTSSVLAMVHRLAVVTGSSRGIGASFVALIAETWPDLILILVARTRPERLPPNARFLVCDLSSPTAVTSLGANLAATLPRVDLLVNNAGTCPQSATPLKHDLHTALNVNAVAPAILTSALALKLSESQGVVINVSSGDGELCYSGSSLRSLLENVDTTCSSVLDALAALRNALSHVADGNGADGGVYAANSPRIACLKHASMP